jgi:hypothetical protein
MVLEGLGAGNCPVLEAICFGNQIAQDIEDLLNLLLSLSSSISIEHSDFLSACFWGRLMLTNHLNSIEGVFLWRKTSKCTRRIFDKTLFALLGV